MTDAAIGGESVDHKLADLHQLVISAYTQRHLEGMRTSTHRLLDAMTDLREDLLESRVADQAVSGRVVRYMIVATADQQLREKFEDISLSLDPEGRVNSEMSREIQARSDILAELECSPEGVGLNDIVRRYKASVPHIRAVVNHLDRWGMLSVSDGHVRRTQLRAAGTVSVPLIPYLAHDPLRTRVDLDEDQAAYMDWLSSRLECDSFPDVRGQTNYLSLYALRRLQWFLADVDGRSQAFWHELVRLHDGYVGRDVMFTAMLSDWEFALTRRLGEVSRLKERAGWRDPAWLVSEHSGSARLSVDWVLDLGGLTSLGRALVDAVKVALADILDSLHDQFGMTYVHYLASKLSGSAVPSDSDLVSIERDLAISIPRSDILKACEESYRAREARVARWIGLVPDGEVPRWREVFPGVSPDVLSMSEIAMEWPGVSATRAAYDANHPWLRRVNREVASALLVRAENAARVSAGLPEIGARWVSELQALHFVRASLPQFEVVHQGRPSWLERQSFDIYIPEIGVAIEYQGVQHDGPVDYFGGQAAFEATRERDARKRRLCLENGVRLVEIREGYDADRLLNELNDAVASRQSTNS